MQTAQNTAASLHEFRSRSRLQVVDVVGLPIEVRRLACMGIYAGVVLEVTKGGITSIVDLEGGGRVCIRPSATLEILCAEIDD